MKAIILAGGEGTRLRPLSMNKPKPMIRLFDRPLLEHIILLLRQSGFTELCMTLHYLPRVIQDYFGDGSDLGVSIEYRLEQTPAGTAGSVRACADFIENDDFLVISGDAACSYDLRAMFEKHRLSGADATILVKQSSDPAEFGLVLAENDGSLRGFVEKPGPERIVSDLINTGIYVLSPSVLAEIPEGRSVDFGGEVFPKMLRNRKRLRVWQADGYWNDVGSCEAYLATCRDVLDGRFPLPIPNGQKMDTTGICWVSPAAKVSAQAHLGPYTVIGEGSTVEAGCQISGSVTDGAYLQQGCIAEDSILSRGVHLGSEARLRHGCVLAEGVSVGSGSLLTENLHVWPGLTVPAGIVLSEDLHRCREAKPLHFRSGGLLEGESGIELTPERCLRMGLGCEGDRVAAAASGGSCARLMAEAFLIGAGSVGKRTFLLDAQLPSVAAAMTGVYDLEQCLFFRQEGSRIVIRSFDADGLPLSRKAQRKLESALSGAAYVPKAESTCATESLMGSEEAFLASALRSCEKLDGVRLACSSGLLRKALLRAGAELCPAEDGIPVFRLSQDGFTVSLSDERGREWPWSLLLCAMTAAEMRCGGTAVVLPYDAPVLAERIAEEENGTIYRLARDGEDARRLWRDAPWCRDGVTLALRFLSGLRKLGKEGDLAGFMDTLPDYHCSEQVLHLNGSDTAVLRQLAREKASETVNGIRLRCGEATATIRRLDSGELRIFAESCKMEAAAEFCESLRRRIRELDR